MDELRAQGYEISIQDFVETTNLQSPAYVDMFVEGLRKAGVPE